MIPLIVFVANKFLAFSQYIISTSVQLLIAVRLLIVSTALVHFFFVFS